MFSTSVTSRTDSANEEVEGFPDFFGEWHGDAVTLWDLPKILPSGHFRGDPWGLVAEEGGGGGHPRRRPGKQQIMAIQSSIKNRRRPCVKSWEAL